MPRRRSLRCSRGRGPVQPERTPLTVPDRYTVTVVAELDGIRGTPVSLGFQYDHCSDDAYAVVEPTTGALECLPCPSGANCAGGLTGQDDLLAEPGFWAPQGSSRLSFYKCPLKGACVPGSSGNLSLCAYPSLCSAGSWLSRGRGKILPQNCSGSQLQGLVR